MFVFIHQNQHDDLKKQYYELQERHQLQEDEHNRAVDEHKQKLDELHQNKQAEVSKLQGITISFTDVFAHCLLLYCLLMFGVYSNVKDYISAPEQ